MNRIEIDTRLLQNDIASLEEGLSEIKNSINDTYDGVLVLNSMWEGAANTAFNAAFANDRERLLEICDEIKKYTESLSEAKAQYEAGEQSVADIISAISF